MCKFISPLIKHYSGGLTWYWNGNYNLIINTLSVRTQCNKSLEVELKCVSKEKLPLMLLSSNRKIKNKLDLSSQWSRKRKTKQSQIFKTLIKIQLEKESKTAFINKDNDSWKDSSSRQSLHMYDWDTDRGALTIRHHIFSLT